MDLFCPKSQNVNGSSLARSTLRPRVYANAEGDTLLCAAAPTAHPIHGCGSKGAYNTYSAASGDGSEAGRSWRAVVQ
jgi:hypothetical protein